MLKWASFLAKFRMQLVDDLPHRQRFFHSRPLPYGRHSGQESSPWRMAPSRTCSSKRRRWAGQPMSTRLQLNSPFGRTGQSKSRGFWLPQWPGWLGMRRPRLSSLLRLSLWKHWHSRSWPSRGWCQRLHRLGPFFQ